MMRATHRAALALVVAVALSSVPRAARADDDPPAGSREGQAATRYDDGLKLLQQNQPGGALAAFDASLALLPSANTLLLRGHALRQLGRRADAMAAYEEVVRSAGARVRLGEERFRPTLSDAGRWVAVLRTELGEVAVDVASAPEDAKITLDGAAIEVTREPGATSLRAHAWHEPGRATLVASAAGHPDQRAIVSVVAGSAAPVHLTFPGAAGAPVPTSSHAPPTVSWVFWGVGAAGLATFGVFGALAASDASKLEGCSPSCHGLHDVVVAGSRDATIANIAIIVAGAGAAVGGVAWIISTSGKPAPAGSAGAARGSIRVDVSGSGVGLRTAF